MENRTILFAVAVLTLCYAGARWIDAQDADPWEPEDESDPATMINNAVRSTFQTWRPPAQYAATIASAEDANGIPRDLLARLFWQECRYRADIIDGRTRSPVGALGIAQFMPATANELGIDPLDPQQAIPAAARYLRSLYARFGNWSEALAAYNWGMGNVQRKGLANAPAETRRYFTSILADVNTANGTAYA